MRRPVHPAGAGLHKAALKILVLSFINYFQGLIYKKVNVKVKYLGKIF